MRMVLCIGCVFHWVAVCLVSVTKYVFPALNNDLMIMLRKYKSEFSM